MTEALCLVFCAVVAILTALHCLRVFPQRASWRRFATLAMPLGQFAFAACILEVAASHAMSPAYLVGICMADAFGCVGICALVWGLSTTQSAEVSNERLRAAEEKARAASEYEALVKESTAELRGLCEGFAVELKALEAAIGKFAESGNGDKAEKPVAFDFGPLENALGKLEETTRSSYCANQTANAILALKARACSAAGVDFAFSGGMPQELATDDLELCSVLSNLLDNAIKAASGAIGEQQSYVRVSCAVKGAYLVVKVTNSCPAAGSALPGAARRRKDKDPAREHGWGLEIVRDICTAHDGSFALERTAPAEATATAILKIAAA